MQNNKQTSRFNRFLWMLAGVDENILSQYTYEHGKYNVIGLMILMTSFTAFVSGWSAAWFFSENWVISLMFGFFWALLIMSIDRSLVVTIKKDPYKKYGIVDYIKEFSGTILFRCALAFIVAETMSIPLELIVFKDFIEIEEVQHEQKKLQALNTNNSYVAGLEGNKNSVETVSKLVSSNQESINQKEGEIRSLEEQIRNLQSQYGYPTTVEYKQAQSNSSRLSNEIGRLEKKKRDLIDREMDTENVDKQISMFRHSYNASKAKEREELNKWNERISSNINSLKAEQSSLKERKEKEEGELEYNRAQLKSHQEKANIQQAHIDSIGSAFEERYQNSNKFIKRYQIFNETINERETDSESGNETFGNYKHKDIRWLYRLIQAIFFLIEILPSLVKIMSAPGSYEKAIKAKEDEFSDYVNSDTYKEERFAMMNGAIAQHLAIQNSQEKQELDLLNERHEAEKRLQTELINKIVESQTVLANEAVENWRKIESGKMEVEQHSFSLKNHDNAESEEKTSFDEFD